jgi:hypothetical protein
MSAGQGIGRTDISVPPPGRHVGRSTDARYRHATQVWFTEGAFDRLGVVSF